MTSDLSNKGTEERLTVERGQRLAMQTSGFPLWRRKGQGEDPSAKREAISALSPSTRSVLKRCRQGSSNGCFLVF
jgi:hypothetical protein